MRRPATVRVRMTIAAVIVVGLGLAVGGVLLVSIHHTQLERDIRTAARLRAQDAASSLGAALLSGDPNEATADSSLTQIVDGSGRVVSASPDLEGFPAISHMRPAARSSSAQTVKGVGPRPGSFWIVAKGTMVGGAPYTVYVAQSREPAEDSTANLAALLAAGLPILLLFVGVLTWFVTGRALRPVEAIRREVESIGGGELHRRVPEPASADEIGRLARTMNAMLGRLEDANTAQRRFVADASHELRTPLTAIRAQLEVDLTHPDGADWKATAQGVLEDATSMQELVGDLLALADLDAVRAVPAPRAPVDLDDVVLAEVARARLITSVAIDTRGVSGAQVLGDGGQLTRLVRNLLDNAVRHAASGVSVTLEEIGSAAVLTVANDGAGIPVEDRQRVFERFARLDDARAEHSGGTGLGLAIVREIAEHHDGQVEVVDGPGAVFRVTLPLGMQHA